MAEKLLSNNQEIIDISISIKNSLIPTILKYLSLFGSINTKSFIQFKIDNENLINKLCQILTDSILIHYKNNRIDKDTIEYIKEVIQQLNIYKIINKNINGDFSKLNKYDYNSEYYKNTNLNNSIKSNDLEIKNNNNETKKLKNKFKNIMKKKNLSFSDKIIQNDEMQKEINSQINNKDNYNNEDESMCFFCRNPIKINSFEVPYGKGGYYFKDLFYRNSMNSSLKSEFLKITKNKNIIPLELYNKISDTEDYIKPLSKHVISCGHYFHLSCFQEKNNLDFSCPLCLKKLNVLIPPLINFHKYNFLKPYKIEQIFNNKEINEKYETFSNLYEVIYLFLTNYLDNLNNEILFDVFPSNFNYLENLFYYNATNFHKLQQIEFHQNLILSLRFMTKLKFMDINIFIDYIKNNLNYLIQGPQENENILQNYENLHYINIIENIFIYLSIIFDYKEIKELLLYILYIILPYLSFGLYLKDLIIKNKFYSFYNEESKEKIDIKNFKFYLEENAQLISDSFKLFLQKLLIIKLITDYQLKDEKIINSFNELNIEKICSILGFGEFYKLLKIKDNNKINLINILETLSKILNFKNMFFGKFGNGYDFNIIFNSLFNNIKKIRHEKYIVKKELLFHFIPNKLEFISLDKNIFDFIEKYLEQKCSVCSKESRFFYICLICGKKICHTISCNQYYNHSMHCGGKYCIMINMDDTIVSITDDKKNEKNFSSLYIDNEGIGPLQNKIGNEFNLSKEKEHLFFKNFISYDFHFN